MRIIADTHTHTIASDHAYSTIRENAEAAAALGLAAIALTEHSPTLPGAPTQLFFTSLDNIPEHMCGVRIIRGIEANILDYQGTLDLKNSWVQNLELIIASYHSTNITPAGRREHTAGWLRVAENKLVDIIGHCGDGRFAFDYPPVLKAFKEQGKAVEINAHSFSVRPGSLENCEAIARLCMELEIPVLVSTDAHHESKIGRAEKSLELLENIGFPEELVLNADAGRFFAWLEERKSIKAEYLRTL